MKILAAILTWVTFTAAAQEKTLSLFAGYSGTDIQIAEKRSGILALALPEIVSGTGFNGGVGIGFTRLVYMDISVSTFRGDDVTGSVNTTTYSYKVRGFHMAFIVNRLFRSPQKRFNIGMGLGAQYVDGHTDLYETSTQGSIRRQRTISQPNYLFALSCRWRVVDHMHIGLNVSGQPTGNSADSASLHLRYIF